jgi:hypothetical protein
MNAKHRTVQKKQKHAPERTRAFAPPAGGCAAAAGSRRSRPRGAREAVEVAVHRAGQDLAQGP